MYDQACNRILLSNKIRPGSHIKSPSFPSKNVGRLFSQLILKKKKKDCLTGRIDSEILSEDRYFIDIHLASLQTL